MAKTKQWQELSRQVIFHKYGKAIERRDYKLPDGTIGDYYIHIQGPGACVLALTPDKKVVTMPQYRPGPDAILRELPGGCVNEGEDPRKAAMRELLEETGYSGDMEDWVGTWQVDAYTQINATVVIARNSRKVAKAKLDDREFGEAELVDIPEFIAQVRSGQLTDAAGAMLALDHLGLL
jgi:ADP-ribose pyrophosphatase